MGTFKVDGVIDANEMWAVAAFLNISIMNFPDQRTEISEFVDSFIGDVLKQSLLKKFSNTERTLNGEELQPVYQIFTKMYALFEAKPPSWFQRRAMTKDQDLEILQDLIAEIEVGISSGKLSFAAFPAELRKPFAKDDAVKSLLLTHGINVEKPLADVFHGKVYDIHKGNNKKLVVI